jgi:uncharacterized protein
MAFDPKPIFRQLGAAIEGQDVKRVRKILESNPGILEKGKAILLLQYAATKDNVELLSALVEHGAGVNAPESDSQPEGALYTAAMTGAERAVGWLLSQGAAVNQVVDGAPRCLPLAVAVRQGHLRVVELLVDHGADVNAVWAGNNALSWALAYKKEEIAEFLKTRGAREPSQPTGEPEDADGTRAVLKHIEAQLGKPEPLALREIMAGDPPIAIHVVPLRNKLALVTVGMSARAMNVPEGGEAYRFAELVIYLPPKWPLTEEALRDPTNFWPIQWLRRIARYPHENRTWLGGKAAVIANGEPPEPLSAGMEMTCLLVVAEGGKFGRLNLPDGRQVLFYNVFPLYTEERDLEKAKGTGHLLRLFEKHRIKPIVAGKRKNMGLKPNREKARRRT